VTWRAALGAIVAVLGVAILMWKTEQPQSHDLAGRKIDRVTFNAGAPLK